MDAMIAEIKMFGGNFAPRQWALCQGQMMSIASNTALFSILGTTYGGDGRTTFALPDFRGRMPIGTGPGPGLPVYRLGEAGGQHNITLLSANMPAHSHTLTLNCSASSATTTTPTNNYLAVTEENQAYSSTGGSAMGASNTGNTGGSQPVSNMPPYLGINFIVCLNGIYPSRN